MTTMLETPRTSKRSATARLSEGQVEFRLGDVNPITGRPYVRCLSDELPLLVGMAIGRLVDESEWDRLVRSGSVAEELNILGSHLVPWSLRAPREPQIGTAGAGSCPECSGTCELLDSDGSMTGVRGGWSVCTCVIFSGGGA